MNFKKNQIHLLFHVSMYPNLKNSWQCLQIKKYSHKSILVMLAEFNIKLAFGFALITHSMDFIRSYLISNATVDRAVKLRLKLVSKLRSNTSTNVGHFEDIALRGTCICCVDCDLFPLYRETCIFVLKWRILDAYFGLALPKM